MTKEEIQDYHKQQVLENALREELAEIIVRYNKAKLMPENIIGILFNATMKMSHAYSASVIRYMEKEGNLEGLLKGLKEDVKKEGK